MQSTRTENPPPAPSSPFPDRDAAFYADHRQARAELLQAEISYVSLVGLAWLQTGENPFGTDLTNAVVFPAGTAPATAGTFHVSSDGVEVTVAPGVTMTTAGGQQVSHMALKSDADGTPDYLHLGDLVMLVLVRGGKFALRVYYKQHPERLSFPGLRWYPVDPVFRIAADYVAYDPPKPITITDAVGHTAPSTSPGYVQFTWQGKTYQLDAQDRGERLFFNFADATNGDTTYGAGRFLYTPLPSAETSTGTEGPTVDLDFNQATNPYCAYTPYATCPLPPPGNRLDFRVEAGEMDYVRALPPI